jgi:hypothetical protein
MTPPPSVIYDLYGMVRAANLPQNLNNMGKQFALNNTVSLFWKIICIEAEFPLVIF